MPTTADQSHDSSSATDASHLITHSPASRTAKLVGEVHVNPQEQLHLRLGEYSKAQPAGGFSVELSPDPDPIDSVVTQITSIGTALKHELVMQIANYGTKAIHATVREM
jgi:hypothetical protein